MTFAPLFQKLSKPPYRLQERLVMWFGGNGSPERGTYTHRHSAAAGLSRRGGKAKRRRGGKALALCTVRQSFSFCFSETNEDNVPLQNKLLYVGEKGRRREGGEERSWRSAQCVRVFRHFFGKPIKIIFRRCKTNWPPSEPVFHIPAARRCSSPPLEMAHLVLSFFTISSRFSCG